MMMTARRLASCALISVSICTGGCMDRLPDQDLRIIDAMPAARLSADILWSEYEADAQAADDAYWGEAIIVTGVVTAIRPPVVAPADASEVDVAEVPWHVVVFGQTATGGIQARLLAEQADTITADLETGQRVTLKCFCEGQPVELDGDILLKSCIAG